MLPNRPVVSEVGTFNKLNLITYTRLKKGIYEDKLYNSPHTVSCLARTIR